MEQEANTRVDGSGIDTASSTFVIDTQVIRSKQSLSSDSARMKDRSESLILPVKKDLIIKVIAGLLILTAAVSIYFVFRTNYTKVFPSKEALICCLISLIASSFWSLHILPLEVTSLGLIPLLVLSNVMVPVGTSLTEGWVKGLFIICKISFSPVLLLLMGSCLLSVYFQENGGGRFILPYLTAGGSSHTDLFRSMFLALVLSSVMSNITGPIIITSMLQNTAKHPSPSVLMGIAMASNIGGMVLPISSPQSILGSNIAKISWIKWITTSVPTACVCFLFVYGLIFCYFPRKSSSEEEDSLIVIDSESERSQTKLFLITALSIGCWSIPSVYINLKWLYAVPVCLLSVTKDAKKVLNRKTLEIISIAVAGTAVGKGIESTKMLEGSIAQLLVRFQDRSILFLILITFFIMLAISCIVCHTVSAIVLLPIFAKIGRFIGKEKIVVSISALACSCGMAFPSSGFPNILSSTFKGANGKRIIPTLPFIAIGSISTVGCWLFILTVSLLFITLEKF